MNIANYIFALYIFALMALLIWIFTKATKSKIDNRIKDLEEQQKELIALQNDTKEALIVFETHIYEAKDNLDKEKRKIKFLIDKFDDLLKNKDSNKQESYSLNDKIDILIDDDYEKNNNNKKRDKIIRELFDKGNSTEQIASELGISEGEVILFLGIKKKH